VEDALKEVMPMTAQKGTYYPDEGRM